MPSSSTYLWLKSYPDAVDWHARLIPKPLYALLDTAERKWGGLRAIDFFGRHYTYAEVADSVRRVAAGLVAMGVRRGVKVGICMPNCPQAIIAYFAILKTGATVVNFSPLYSASEMAHQITDSGTEVMVTLSLQATYPKVAENLGKTCLRKIIVSGLEEALPFAKRLAFPLLKRAEIAEIPTDSRHVAWQNLLDFSPMKDFPVIHPESDIAVLQYTGGTTGVPKGVILTHANLYINALQCGLWFSDAEKGCEKIMGVLPLFHVFAMTTVMNFGIHIGAEIILHPRFELKKLLEDINDKKPTLMPGVPTLFNAISHYREVANYTLTSLKYCISGGAPLPVEVKRQFEEMTHCVLVEGYGLSETSPVVACNPLTGTNKAGSIGLPFPNTILEVVDKDNPNQVLGVGEVGEICVRAPQVMHGYWQQLDETNQVFHHGRLHTGDLGYQDEDGYFFIVDRLKEMIISGGFNIYPRHVEEAIYQHPAVLECAVIGIPHEKRGEVPQAFVVLKPLVTLSPTELGEFLKDALPNYAIPRDIILRDSLPKTMVGKVDKKALRKVVV
jgi:long-chain acyl-CoA synthetase